MTTNEQQYRAAMQTFLPHIEAAAQQVSAMPTGTLAASQARASAFMSALYDNKGSYANTYEALRERYVAGRITLGQFEVEVESWLRSAA